MYVNKFLLILQPNGRRGAPWWGAGQKTEQNPENNQTKSSMKKLYTLVMLLAAVSAAPAQNPLPCFVNFSDKGFGALTPKADDRQFSYNSETGRYDITLEYDIESTDKFMRFYQKDGETVKQWGPLVWTRLLMADDREYKLYVEDGRTSALQITGFYADATKSNLNMSIVPGDTTLYLRQIIEEEYVPEKIYLWGSNDGGFHMELFGELSPTEDNPTLYKADIMMPTWYFDPASVLADFAANAFFFCLNTNGESYKKGMKFVPYMSAETGETTYSLINLSDGETFSSILQTAVQDSAWLTCITPGKMTLTFDFKTYEFTATMNEAMNHAELTFDGIPTAIYNNYFTVENQGADNPLFINPQSVWYWGDLELSIAPLDGYEVNVECTTEDADCTLTEKNGVFTLKSEENGLEFLVTYGEKKEEKILMGKATLLSPDGKFCSEVPRYVEVTWNNQPITLVDPQMDELGDEYGNAFVTLDDDTQIEVKAYIMYSEGNPADPTDNDLWNLQLSLYESSEIKNYKGSTLSVTLPEGLVENKKGEVSPEQTFSFEIMWDFDWKQITVTPEDGSTIVSKSPEIKLSFAGNPIEFLQSKIRVIVYKPKYKDYYLTNGTQVVINDENELVIKLGSINIGNSDIEVIIPAGFVKVNVPDQTLLSPEYWLAYIVKEPDNSGVDCLPGEDNERFDVYNLQGIRILENAERSELEFLPTGLYIINGEKTLINN